MKALMIQKQGQTPKAFLAEDGAPISQIRHALGLPDSYACLINGEPAEDHDVPGAGDVVSFATRNEGGRR